MAVADFSPEILEHSRFFDHLVELIPARFYYTDEEPLPKLRFMKAQDREKEKETRKALAKEAKRQKLDPDLAKTTLELQKTGGFRRAVPDEDDDDAAEQEPAGPSDGKERGSGNPKLAELKEKLHKRLEVYRQERKAEERRQQVKEATEFRNKSRSRELPKPPPRPQQNAPEANKRKQPEGAPEQQGNDASLALSFGKLEFGEDAAHVFKKQKKPSKFELLKQAERKEAERKELVNSSDGQAKIQQDAWTSALKRAKGEKVYDDPKLLRKSLKRDEKQKSKSAAAWKERNSQQKKEMKEKQKKRKDNLQARAQAKKEKKIERREKKLMRPGFEGRRDTFINGPKAA